MALILSNFLHSLVRLIASRTALVYWPAVLSSKRDLFLGFSDPSYENDPFSVLLGTGGFGRQWDPLPGCSVQIATTGTSVHAVLNRAQRLFESLLDDEGHALGMYTFSGYKQTDNTADGQWLLVGVNLLQSPGIVGVDKGGRQISTFNCDLRFDRKE